MLSMADAHVVLYRSAFSSGEADDLFRELRQAIGWRQETVRANSTPQRLAWRQTLYLFGPDHEPGAMDAASDGYQTAD